MNAKKWNLFVLLGTGAILLLIATVTIVIDPFFHFHRPLDLLEYPMKDERYQNDGIARWYEYDAMITGTSMTQNFKTSELDERMGVTSVKTSYSGSGYYELSRSIRRALEYNPNLKMVLCSMDGNRIMYEPDAETYEGYPEYLYDSNPFNDVNYVLNKDVVPKTLAVLNYTRAGEKTPTMDEYGSWGQYQVYGKEAVLATLPSLPEFEEESVLTDDGRKMVRENLEQNFLNLALEYPDTEFYFFFPPYSICYWEALYQTKQLNMQLEAELLAVETVLQAENIHVFAFADWIEVISDLDNYMDSLHYSPEINSEILRAVSEGEGELTLDNYKQYYEMIKEYYTNYDYSTIRAE